MCVWWQMKKEKMRESVVGLVAEPRGRWEKVVVIGVRERVSKRKKEGEGSGYEL